MLHRRTDLTIRTLWCVSRTLQSANINRSYLMEKGRQEKDSWLAEHFTESLPEQRLVKVAARETKGAFVGLSGLVQIRNRQKKWADNIEKRQFEQRHSRFPQSVSLKVIFSSSSASVAQQLKRVKSCRLKSISFCLCCWVQTHRLQHYFCSSGRESGCRRLTLSRTDKSLL